MLTRLKVDNFKNLRHVEAQLAPLNVIIGPNGCGKSSLLQAIDFLRGFVLYDTVQQYLDEREWRYSDLPNLRQSGKLIAWDLDAELPGEVHGSQAGTYHYEISLQPRRYLGIGHERLTVSSPSGRRTTVLDRRGRQLALLDRSSGEMTRQMLFRQPASVMALLEPDQAPRYPDLFEFRSWVSHFRSFLIWDPKVLRKPDRRQQGEREPELGLSGERLASVLAVLKAQNRPAFEQLVRRVRRLFPTVSAVDARGGRKWGWREIELTEEAGGQRARFNSRQVSDGILRLLAVLSFRYSDRVPSVLTFEEPENGVHPRLVRDVVQILRELTQRKTPYACQVFITTHSAYLLDEFIDHPEQVQVMQRGRPSEGAAMYRLSDRANLDLVRETFDRALGEVWLSGLLDQGRGEAS